MEKSSRQADPKLKAGQLHAPVAGGGRIFVRSSERILFLKPGEIDRVEAAGNYVVLHSCKEQHILRETISAMEARLGSAGFMRISRSVIVNLTCIREVQPIGSGRNSLLLKNGTRLDWSAVWPNCKRAVRKAYRECASHIFPGLLGARFGQGYKG